VRWYCTVPGRPVSLNKAYRTALVPVKRKGVPVLLPDGTPKLIHRPILTPEAERWRDACQMLMQAARPSAFRPVQPARIRVRWTFYVTTLIDSDNLEKLPADGLKRAIDYDDRYFNQCVQDVIVVSDPREARVEMVVDSNPACCCTPEHLDIHLR
jgi:hypothetical protein